MIEDCNCFYTCLVCKEKTKEVRRKFLPGHKGKKNREVQVREYFLAFNENIQPKNLQSILNYKRIYSLCMCNELKKMFWMFMKLVKKTDL